MKSGPSGPYVSPRPPRSRQNASKSAHMSACVRWTSSRKRGQAAPSSDAEPLENGGIAGSPGLGGRRAQPHPPLLEAARLERAGEALLHDEHDAMATTAEHVADADAVVGRPVRALGEEDDRASGRARVHAAPAVDLVPIRASRPMIADRRRIRH